MKKTRIRKIYLLCLGLSLLCAPSFAKTTPAQLKATIAQQEEALLALEASITQLSATLEETKTSNPEQSEKALTATAALKGKVEAVDQAIMNLEAKIKTLEAKVQETTALVTLTSGTTINVTIPRYSNGQIALQDDKGSSKNGPIAMIKDIQFRQNQELDTFPEKKAVAKTTRPKTNIPTYTGPPLIDFKILRSKKTRVDDKQAGYVDEKRQNFKYTITVQSKEMTRSHEGLTCYLFVVGENLVKKPEYQMFINEKETFSIGIGETHVFESKDKEIWYDDKGAMYGAKYYGYLTVLMDKDGKIITMKRSKSSLEKAFEQLKSISEDQNFSL